LQTTSADQDCEQHGSGGGAFQQDFIKCVPVQGFAKQGEEETTKGTNASCFCGAEDAAIYAAHDNAKQ